MLVRSKQLFLFSTLLFIVDFLTLANLNFTRNKTLQSIGKIIAVVSILAILTSFILAIVELVKKKAQQPQKPLLQVKNRGKKFIGLFILAWLLIVFPIIGMNRMGILHKMLEGTTGSLFGQLLFIILATVATIYPGLYLSPMIVFVVPLLILMVYFLFSKSWHKWFDGLLVVVIIILIILQIKTLFSL